jgi:CPA2 family monovalent cation:H+ antiporter-2
VVLLAIFVTAALVGVAFRKLRIEAIPGYLLAGAIIGPHALGLVQSETSVDQISELALVLLMFGIGLHMDLSAMQRGLVRIVLLGVLSTLAVVGVCWGLFITMGSARPNALILAFGAGISSTAVLMRVLAARREIATPHGRVTVGTSIVQDLVSVVMLAVIPVIVTFGGGAGAVGADAATTGLPGWTGSLLRGLLASSGVFLMLVLGRKLLPLVLDRIARLQSSELMLVSAAAIALLSAGWSTYIGFGPAMGAFLAGFLLASTPYRYQLSGMFAPMRDLLMAVFFVSVGLRVAPLEVWNNLGGIAIALVGVLLVKTIVIALSGYLAGMTAQASLMTGAYLANAGEFSLVLIAAGAGLLTPAETGAAIAVVILSLVATPFLVPVSHKLADRLVGFPLSPWLRGRVARNVPKVPKASVPAEPDATPVSPIDVDAPAVLPLGEEPTAAPSKASEDLPIVGEVGEATPLIRPRSVIIAGYGPIGRAIADRFAIQGVQTTIIELNASTVERQHKLGRRVVYGDVTNRDVLEHAGLSRADAFILTIPDEEATLKAVQIVRDIRPDLFLAARARVLSSKFVMMSIGADVVTVEEVATAVAMEREVLDSLSRWLAAKARGVQHPTV